MHDRSSPDTVYLGDWTERESNRNIEVEALTAFLKRQGTDPALIQAAIHELVTVAGDLSMGLYAANKAVYRLLRYGVKVKTGAGDHKTTVWLVDWKHPKENDFGIAEEVTIQATDPKASGKRPDLVLYVNGIALGVIELKRSTVSVSQGIRQNLDNQKKDFIEPFFSTLQYVMAGIRAEESEKISTFDDLSLIQLIVERGEEVVQALPEGIQANHDSAAETIENNVRKLIIDEQPVNPKYYEDMSKLLDALIDQRRKAAITYKEYLAQVVELTKKAKNPGGATYPSILNTPAKRSLYDNLSKDEATALRVHEAVLAYRQDDWRHNTFKLRRVRNAIREALNGEESQIDRILELVKNQREY